MKKKPTIKEVARYDPFFVAYGSRNSAPRPEQLRLRDQVTRTLAELTPEEQAALQRIFDVCALIQLAESDPDLRAACRKAAVNTLTDEGHDVGLVFDRYLCHACIDDTERDPALIDTPCPHGATS